MPLTIETPEVENRQLVPALTKGARCRCPHCGEGRLFYRFLKPVAACPACGEDLSHQRADDAPPAERASLDAHLTASALSAERPTLFVLVLGETARADHWAHNGYERDTNRYTAAHDIVNYPHVVACGTSTADSLPMCRRRPRGDS